MPSVLDQVGPVVAPTPGKGEGKLWLSVLVPVYNWDVAPLLSSLMRQVEPVSGEVELVVVDDASSDRERLAGNDAFCSQHEAPCLRYHRLDANLGRSAVRNLLAEQASGDFLLFLDCDVLPDTGDFLRSYLDWAKKGTFDVVCGGVSYRTRVLTDRRYDYHAYLGRKKEVQPADLRNRQAWRFILTSNVMVRKSVFLSTPFDERFTGYGYEDVEWGVRLSKRFRILHIDNTASHLGLVAKGTAYEKMRASVPNYLLLRRLCPEAFAAAAIGGLAAVLSACHGGLLRFLDRLLKGAFLHCRPSALAFVLFQLNFAVLLASALKAEASAGTSGKTP